MPWDFALWAAVQNRLDQQAKKGKETVAEFKARLRRAALGLPKAAVQKAASSMKRRIKEVYDAKGKKIKGD